MRIYITTDDIENKNSYANILALDLFNGEPNDNYVYYKNTEIYNIDNVKDYYIKEEDGKYVLKVRSEGFSNFFVDYFEDVKQAKNKYLFLVDEINNKALCLNGIRPIRFDDMYFNDHVDYRFINHYEITFVLKDYFSIKDLVEHPVYRSDIKFRKLYVNLHRIRNDIYVYLLENSVLMGNLEKMFVNINEEDYPYIEIYMKDDKENNLFITRQSLRYYDIPVYHCKVYDKRAQFFRVEFKNKPFIKNKYLGNVLYTIDDYYLFDNP